MAFYYVTNYDMTTSTSITMIIPSSYWAVQSMFSVPCTSYWTIRWSWLKLFEESHKDLRRMIVLSNLRSEQTLGLMRTEESSPLLLVRGHWPPPGRPPPQLTPSHRTRRTTWVIFHFVLPTLHKYLQRRWNVSRKRPFLRNCARG